MLGLKNALNRILTPIDRQQQDMSPSLADRLFSDFDQRKAIADFESPNICSEKVKCAQAFKNKSVLLFSHACHDTMNCQIWLEQLFDLKTLSVHEIDIYDQWLTDCAGQYDLAIVNQDSFAGDEDAFDAFMRRLNTQANGFPIIVLSRHFAINDIAGGKTLLWDCGLKSPISRTSLWLAVNACAGDLPHRDASQAGLSTDVQPTPEILRVAE